MVTEKGMVRDFLYRYVARYKGMVFLSLSLMLVVAVSRMAPAYILKVAIDKYISRGDFYGLSLMALFYLFFILLEYAGIYLQVYVSQLFGQSVIRDMRLGDIQPSASAARPLFRQDAPRQEPPICHERHGEHQRVHHLGHRDDCG